MSRPRVRVYPFLLAIAPVLHLAAANPGQASLDDLAVVLVVVLAGCAIAYGVVALLERRRWGGRLAPLAVLAAVLWFWGYVRVVDLVGHRGSLSTHLVVFPLGVLATAGLGWWLLRRPAVIDRVATLLTMAGALLAGWSALSIGIAETRSARELGRSDVVRRLAKPIPVRPGAATGPRRDIYLIVLDEYANAETTRERYGFDNRPFLDSLRRLGFVVPVVRSNYLHTVLSIPSLLNASQIADLSGDVGRRTVDPTLPNYLVENNRSVAFLEAHGYEFAFFPSFWWLSTRHNRHADVELDGGSGFDFVRAASRSELRRDLRVASMLDLLHREAGWSAPHGEYLKRTFAALSQVPGAPGPVFAFAHILSPHQPITLDRDCRPLAARGGPAKNAESRYVGQIECLDRMVLRLVTTLLRESDVAPVILLQGDHGTSSPAFDSAATTDEISAASARERFGAFGAYYLPDRGARAFGDTVTIVNVLGDVLRYYMGADLPREPDDMYLSTYRAPYAFTRVNLTWLAQADSADLRRDSVGANPIPPSR